jgi:hypothetical protein
MTPIEQARVLLPTMPEEVFTMWIADIVKRNGWPFTHIYSEPLGRWRGYFCGMSLQMISQLRWERQVRRFSITALHPHARNSIETLFRFHFRQMKQGLEVAPDSYVRIMSQKTYIKGKGKFPKPVIFFSSLGNLQILDGHHRLAALLYFPVPFVKAFQMDCWMASL